MKVGITISTVNEAETIGALVAALVAKGYFPFVVDASTDGTWQTAITAGALVKHLEQPCGIGWHLRTAWGMALDAQCDVIVQMDAGGSHAPNDADEMIQRLRYDAMKHNPAMILGTRFGVGAQYIGNPKRQFISRLATWACNTKKHTHWTDWTSGYRVLTAQAVKLLSRCSYAAHNHAWQIEALDYVIKLGFNLAESPITYTAGRSSFNRRAAREALMVYQLL